MPLPNGVQTVTITAGPYLTSAGRALSGTFTLTPAARRVHVPSGTVLLAHPEAVKLVDGSAQLIVPASDAADVSPTGVTYRAQVSLGYGVASPPPVDVFLPASQPTVDLDSLVPVQASTGVTVQVPTGEPGPAGPKGDPGDAGDAGSPALRKLFAGLANSRTAPVRVAFVGSSTAEGVGASTQARTFADLLVRSMQAVYPSGGPEHAPARSFTAAFGTPSPSAGVQGYNAGKSGALSSNYLDGTTTPIIAGLNPRAVVHMVGGNDFRDSVAPATVAANVRAKIDALNASITGPVVHILVHHHQRMAEVGTIPWADYADALAGLADADPDNLAFFDASEAFRVAGVPGADPLNLVGADDIHLTDAGHALLHDEVRRWLGVASATQASSAAVAILVSDTFTRADATGLGTPEIGPAWSDGGSFAISGGRATAAGNGHAFVEVGSGDMDVQADVVYSGGNAPIGIQANATDSGNRVVLYLNPTDATHSTLTLANFGGSAPGVTYAGAAGAVDTSSGKTHTLRLSSKGAQLTAYLDGAQVWTYTMTAAEQTLIKARTRAGLRMGSPTGAALDNFVVKTTGLSLDETADSAARLAMTPAERATLAGATAAATANALVRRNADAGAVFGYVESQGPMYVAGKVVATQEWASANAGTSANTPDAVVRRDGSGGFSANYIAANIYYQDQPQPGAGNSLARRDFVEANGSLSPVDANSALPAGTYTIVPAWLPSVRSYTLAGNVTLALGTGFATGRAGVITWVFRQPATGGPYTVTWPAGIVWAGGSPAPTMPTAAGAELIVDLRWTGQAWRGIVVGSFFP